MSQRLCSHRSCLWQCDGRGTMGIHLPTLVLVARCIIWWPVQGGRPSLVILKGVSRPLLRRERIHMQIPSRRVSGDGKWTNPSCPIQWHLECSVKASIFRCHFTLLSFFYVLHLLSENNHFFCSMSREGPRYLEVVAKYCFYKFSWLVSIMYIWFLANFFMKLTKMSSLERLDFH